MKNDKQEHEHVKHDHADVQKQHERRHARRLETRHARHKKLVGSTLVFPNGQHERLLLAPLLCPSHELAQCIQVGLGDEKEGKP